jgi:hypothetical protein
MVLSEIIQSNDFFDELLQELMNKIELICLSKNTKTAIDNLIQQYLEVFKLFNKFDTKMLQSLVNNYLLDIINYVIQSDPTLAINNKIKIIYHKDLDNLKMAIFRQLYNDYNYYTICKLLNSIIDPRAESNSIN